jgi:hypothetical protein
MNARWTLGTVILCAAVLQGGPAGGGGPNGPDLTAKIESTYQSWPRRDTVITVAVTNIGDAPAPKSVCLVYFRNAHPPRQTLRRIRKPVRGLDPGDRFLFSYSVKLGLGLFEIEVVADGDKKIAETDETNNKAKMTIAGQVP